ncbi:hypothetical protein BGZ76_006345, partial [Entomortierella beljakovae]
MLNEMRIRAFWACALWIDHQLQKTPAPSNLDKRLDEVIDSKDFIHGLATLLYTGQMGTRSKYHQESKHDPAATKPTQLQAYELFQAQTSLRPLNEAYPGFTVGKSSSMLMIFVQAALRAHYRNAEFNEEKTDDNKSSISFFFEQNSVEKKYVDFPKSAFSPRALCLSEHSLLEILWSNNEAREMISTRLSLTKTTKGAAEEKVLGQKGILFKTMFSMKGYKGVGLQSDNHVPTPRRQLRPSFFTNGLTLTLLAYDTSKYKRGRGPQVSQVSQSSSAQPGPSSSSAQLGSSSSNPAGMGNDGDGDEDEDIEGDEDLFGGIDDDDIMQVDKPFIGEIEEDEEEVEEGSSSTNPLSPVSVNLRSKVNWKQRSRLLENVEAKYNTSTVCPDPNNTVIIGIDPGEKYSMTIAKLDPQRANEREILRVSRNYLYRPLKKFRRALEERKLRRGITAIETHIPPFSRSTLTQYFDYMKSLSSQVPSSTGSSLTA